MSMEKLVVDRSNPPKRVPVSNVIIPKPEIFELSNGFKVVVINAGTQDLCKIEIIFRAGTRYQTQPLVANAAISLLSEGTSKRTSAQIAEELDFYGSFLEPSFSRDFSSISFYTIGKHFYPSVDVLSDILLNPVYPQHELEIFCRKGKQSLLVELEKVSTLSRQRFFSALFGSSHPYGSFATPHDYDHLSREAVKSFRQRFHTSQNGLVVIAGKLDSKQVNFLLRQIDVPSFKLKKKEITDLPEYQTTTRRVFTYKKDAVQSSIRIGTIWPKRNHADMPGLNVLNTLLGGYFGSRLMRHIREEKGYTYGVTSYILPFSELSVFLVSTEVGAGLAEATMNEVFHEMKRLQTEPLPTEELELVKGYMTGQLLRTFDGPLAIAESMASLHQYNNLDFGYIEKLVNTINNITSEQLKDLACRYLDTGKMVVSIAGGDKPKGFEE